MSSRQASTFCSRQSSSTIPDGYVTREDFERLIRLVETSFKTIHAKIDRLTAEVADINLAITRLDGSHGNGPEAKPTEPHSQTTRVSESSVPEKGSDRDTFTEDTSEGRKLDETTNEKDTPGLTPERKVGEVVPNGSGPRRKLQYKDEPPVPGKKHLKFVKEPIGEKTVFELQGIGEALGGRLEKKGFGLAKDLRDMYLQLNGDENEFLHWINKECGANKKQGGDCYRCLKEWCEIHSSQS